jgi:photosystem II stability/assembly factor-like uncharacterized protein
VDAISASGEQIAVVGFGPTGQVSEDGGKTWWPAPDLGRICDGVVAGQHAFAFEVRAEGPNWIWRATSAAGPWTRVPLPEGVTPGVELLGADGTTLAIARGGAAYLTTDVGAHWTALGEWPLPVGGMSRGLVHGDEVFSSGLDGMVRSQGGSPFADVTRHFTVLTPRQAPDVRRFFQEGDTTFAVATDGLYAWDRKRDLALTVTARLPLGTSPEWNRIEDAAVDGSRVLVNVASDTGNHLVLSPDFGATWVAVDPPIVDASIGPVAHGNTGFLIGQRGVWAEDAE